MTQEDLDDADDSDTPKAALIDLIVAREPPSSASKRPAPGGVETTAAVPAAKRLGVRHGHSRGYNIFCLLYGGFYESMM